MVSGALPRFSPRRLAEIEAARMIGVRSGSEHRYTGVWVVVVERRVFVRSWDDKPSGWYRAFCGEPRGRLRIGSHEIAVRARRTRSERLLEAVTRAYGAKYATKAAEKWVRGFAEPQRSRTTLELLPD